MAVNLVKNTTDVETHTLYWDSTTTDVNETAQFVFGHLFMLAAPVVNHYASDLYHDALWLKEFMVGRSFTFYWSVNDCGTCIGTESLALERKNGYRLTVALDERNRTVLTIEPIK